MEGKCDQECWCHVPTRGRNKPPCYLCVVQNCSHSRRLQAASSSFQQDKQIRASAPEAYDEDAVASSSVSVPSECMASYGWSPSLRLLAEEDLKGQAAEPCPPEQDFDKGLAGGAPDVAAPPSVAWDSCSSVSPDGFPDEAHDLTGQGRENRQKWDLSDRIRSLVLGNGGCSPLDSCADERHFTPKERDADDSLDPRGGAIGLCEDAPPTGRRGRGAPETSLWSSGLDDPLTREDEYQRINRINRRESSEEAARRHLQREENPRKESPPSLGPDPPKGARKGRNTVSWRSS